MLNYATVEEYIVQQPAEVQPALRTIRAQMQGLLPGADETIGYAMPTYKLKKRNIVHFAAFKNHIGIFPGSQVCEELAAAYPQYVKAKGTIHLPLEGPFPHPFIDQVVQLRMQHFTATGK
jgi:uncharacterized protein YdhG (YjbR/CyaY superfamily)